jgi:hypothetical protein
MPGIEKPIGSGTDGVWRDLSSIAHDIDGAFLSSGLGAARLALEGGQLPVLESPIERFGPPLASIGKVVCIGLNYSGRWSQRPGTDSAKVSQDRLGGGVGGGNRR